MPGGPCRRRCLKGALFFFVFAVLTAILLNRLSRLGSNTIWLKAASPREDSKRKTKFMVSNVNVIRQRSFKNKIKHLANFQSVLNVSYCDKYEQIKEAICRKLGIESLPLPLPKRRLNDLMGLLII